MLKLRFPLHIHTPSSFFSFHFLFALIFHFWALALAIFHAFVPYKSSHNLLLLILVGSALFGSRSRVFLRYQGSGFSGVSFDSKLLMDRFFGADADVCLHMPTHPNSEDSILFLSPGHHVDVYFPPRKRSRISAPFVFHGATFTKPQTIDVLPDECLFEIFRRLPGGQEKSSCASVSKRWLSLLSTIRKDEICKAKDVETNDDGCLARCLKGKKATDVRLAAIAVGAARRGGLGELSVHGSNVTRGVTNFGLRAVARGCPLLKTLSLWNLSSVGDEGLIEIANECRLLEKLDLSRCPAVSDVSLLAIANNCPNLMSLTIESCSNIGNEGVAVIGQKCPNLTSVSITNCPRVGDRGVTSLLSLTSRSLTKLTLHGLNIGNVSLAVIGHYGISVTDLSLVRLHNVTEKGFWVMGNGHGLQKLRSLAMESCSGVTDLGLGSVGRGCPNLKRFSLRKPEFLSDNGLVSFATAAISLENLALEDCHGITQLGIFGMLEKSCNLKKLSLLKCFGIKDLALEIPSSPINSLKSLSVCNCPGFGDVDLALFGRVCPKLEYVELTGLHGITDSGLTPLINGSKSGLTTVDLTDCVNLTDRAATEICRLHGGTLEVLNLSGCKSVTDETLLAVAEHCLLLAELDVSKSAITDAGVAAVARAIQLNLQVLSVTGCRVLSDESVSSFLKMGESQALVGLNIQKCDGITSDAVGVMMERMWNCDILP